MQTQPVLSIRPRFVLVVFALILVGPQRLPAQSQYTIAQITSGSPDHVSPATNNKGDMVWSQMLNGFSQVYILPKGQSSPSLLRGQQGNHNNQFPVIDDAGDVVYLKDGVGGGPGLVVVRNSGGNESTIEFSSGNPPGCTEPPAGPPTCSSFRGAGQHFGISSGGTTISYFDFSLTGARRFDVSGAGTLQCNGAACNFSGDDYPSINNNGDFIFSASGQVQKSSLVSSSTTGTPVASGTLGRINNSGDVVIVSAGQVQVYLAPSYTTVQPVNPGTWADIDDSGIVVFQNKDNSGIQQVFVATPSSQLAAPTNLQAVQIGNSGTDIQLTWDYGSNPIDGFNIDRIKVSDISSTGNYDWSQAVTVSVTSSPTCTSTAGSGLSCIYDDVDSAINNFETFLYRVRAFQGNNLSAYSNTDAAYQLKKLILDKFGQPVALGPAVQSDFTPDATLMVHDAAVRLGYDHFNWISVINHDPACDELHGYLQSVTLGLNTPSQGALQAPPYLDPPPGGYFEYGNYSFLGLRLLQCQDAQGNAVDCNGPSDQLPFYWNEQPAWYLNSNYGLNPGFDIAGFSAGSDQTQHNTAQFFDLPTGPCFSGSDYEGFYTTLVGVRTVIGGQPANYDALASFGWNTTFNGKGRGGINGFTTYNIYPPVIDGVGGIFNVSPVSLRDLPLEVRQVLIQAGANGITTAPKIDKDAPMTASFLSGRQGRNGWYTGPVTITLIATDIDGSSDIAATSYSLDGGPLRAYNGSFTVSADGIHTIQFGSVDRAGNTEVNKAITIKIDQTPPTITPTRTPAPNVNGWNNTSVTVSFQCSDNVSGLGAGSPPAPTTLSAEGANQSVTGTCTDVAGNSASAAVSGINIDKTPPTVACSASPSVLWPPNNKLVPLTLSATVNDSLSGSVGFTLLSVNSNEPDSGQGDIQGFVTGTASTIGQIRAQRLGSGTGRVYTFAYSGADKAGNTASCTTSVMVPHDQGQN